MGQDVPDDVKIRLGSTLARTSEFQVRLGNLGTPDFIALGEGQTTAAARNLAPQARAIMDHVALVVQVARYHLYLASYERIRQRDYCVPANATGGNIAVEHHLTLAFSLRFGYMNHNKTRVNGQIGEVRRLLTNDGNQALADVLKPFQEDAQWRWLKNYRDRWDHRDPMRIAEYGLQFSNKRAFWTEEPTTLPYDKPGRALELVITDGDPPETTVDEMLEQGTYCFNLLAKQIDSYIGILEAGHQNPAIVKM